MSTLDSLNISEFNNSNLPNFYMYNSENECDDLLVCPNKGWCLPLWIYLFLSFFTLFGYIFSKHTLGATTTYVLLNVLLIFVIAFIIYYLCKQGHVGWAWFVLFLPLIFELTWIILVASLSF